MFLVSAIWVCASFIVKDLERVGDPLTLTALFNALFLVYWPVEMKGYFYHLAEKKKKKEGIIITRCSGNGRKVMLVREEYHRFYAKTKR